MVNLDCLKAQEDVVVDDIGVWKNNGVNLTQVCVTFQSSCPMEIRNYPPKVSVQLIHIVPNECTEFMQQIKASER